MIPATTPLLRTLAGLLLAVPLMACAHGSTTVEARSASQPDARASRSHVAAPTGRRAVRHVFVINLENKGFERTWGAESQALFLAKTLRDKGVLLTNYYGTAHHSLGNYLAQVSGQGPTSDIQRDCPLFRNLHTRRVARYGQRVGNGCVFDRRTPTLMGQLDHHHRTWRGYMQDMDHSCQHPRVGARDNAHKARPGHQYATRHDPFVYFHSVIDRPAYCRHHVVSLSHLTTDLHRIRTTRNLSYITPDLCNDAHDSPCADGRPGGLAQLNVWLRHWVPKILASPAFRRDGMLVITADESDGAAEDSTACCGEGATPNVVLPGITGPGGGRIGALVISRWTRPGSSSETPYNHYSLLGTVEKVFDAPLIGYARTPGLRFFGGDVFNR